MSSDFNYAHFYARQAVPKQHVAYQDQQSGTISQYSSAPVSEYGRDQYTDQYAGPVRQDTPQWGNGHSNSQSPAYNDAAQRRYPTSQAISHSYQDSSKSIEVANAGSVSYGHQQSTANRSNIVSQSSTQNSNYYQQSPPPYSRIQQQHVQAPHQQAAYSPSDYNRSQYGQAQRHPTGAISGQPDSPGAPAGFDGTKHSGHVPTGTIGTPQQRQTEAIGQSARTGSNENPVAYQKPQLQHESVPANMSAPRVSAPQDRGHLSTTVDPSEVYNPLHEYEQVVQRVEAKKSLGVNQGEKEAETTAQGQHVKLNPQMVSNKSRRETAPKKSAKSSNTADDMSAAMTLLQASNANNPNATQSEKDDLQAQMMEMFKKMREFNQKDPDMLSRLWQQERDQHLAKSAQAKASAVEAAVDSSPSTSAQGRKQRAHKSGAKSVNRAITSKAASPASVSTAPLASATRVLGPDKHQEGIATESPRVASNPSRSSAPRTIWPADKKGALAQTAVDFIKGNPNNRSTDISPSDVSAILDTNPNYVELCEAIEKRGLELDRNTFAKHLLKAVPGPKSTAGQGSKGQAAGRATVVPPPVADVEARLQSGESLLPSPNTIKDGSTRIENSAMQPVEQSETPSKIVLAEGNSISQSATSIDPTLEGLDAVKAFVDDKGRPVFFPSKMKQKAAKKAARQRNETSASATPGPQSKEELARKRTFGDLVDLTLISESEGETDIYYPPAKRQDLEPEAQQDSTTQESVSATAQENTANTQRSSSTMTGVDWAGLGPRPTAVPDVDAMIKSSQSLPARPPAASMNVQRATVDDVPNSGPSNSLANASSTRVIIPPDHPARRSILALPLDKSKAFRRSTYDARTIARDVLLACGRHPEMRHLNAHLEHLKQAFPSLRDNNADLSTINWDVVDPGGPPAGWGTRPQPDPPLEIGSDADDEDDDDEGGENDKLGTGTSGIVKSGKVRLKDGQGATRTPRPLGPRRPRHSMPVNSTPSARLANPTTAPNSAPSGESSGYAALRPLDELGNPIKKKGRPVGWRKWMQKGGNGNSGKAPKVARSQKPEPEPVYQVYKCEWRDCRAELHNLETLRKHIHKVHGRNTDENGEWPCHWSSCCYSQQVVDPSTNRTTSRLRTYAYAEREDWKDHIEREHLRPIAWKQGDGPAGGISDRDSELSEAYMSDRQGRRVTPQIAIPDESPAAGSTLLRKFKRTAEEEARLELANAERKKRDTGPGVDKGGARLANEKRRQGLIDDATEAQIFDDDE